MYLYCKWKMVLFHIFSLSSSAVKLMKGEGTVDNTCQKRCNSSQQSFKILNTVCKHAVFYVVFTCQFSKPQKISKTLLHNYISIVQRTEYCSHVSCFIQTSSTVKCIIFPPKSSRQIQAISLN